MPSPHNVIDVVDADGQARLQILIHRTLQRPCLLSRQLPFGHDVELEHRRRGLADNELPEAPRRLEDFSRYVIERQAGRDAARGQRDEIIDAAAYRACFDRVLRPYCPYRWATSAQVNAWQYLSTAKWNGCPLAPDVLAMCKPASCAPRVSTSFSGCWK